MGSLTKDGRARQRTCRLVTHLQIFFWTLDNPLRTTPTKLQKSVLGTKDCLIYHRVKTKYQNKTTAGKLRSIRNGYSSINHQIRRHVACLGLLDDLVFFCFSVIGDMPLLNQTRFVITQHAQNQL